MPKGSEIPYNKILPHKKKIEVLKISCYGKDFLSKSILTNDDNVSNLKKVKAVNMNFLKKKKKVSSRA